MGSWSSCREAGISQSKEGGQDQEATSPRSPAALPLRPIHAKNSRPRFISRQDDGMFCFNLW